MCTLTEKLKIINYGHSPSLINFNSVWRKGYLHYDSYPCSKSYKNLNKLF